MPSILVVDDSAVDRRLVGGLLKKACDCDVTYAADGMEALQQFEGDAPDLVVTDLQMPEMNGLELVTAIKNDHPFVPIVLMTAKGSEEIAAEALKLGAASYVPKSRLADDLVPTVLRILASAREEQTHARLMHYLIGSEVTLCLRNDYVLIQSAVSFLQQLLRCMPLGSETERLRVGIALEEALFNAYYHGNLEMGTPPANVDRGAFEETARERALGEPYRDRRIHVRARVSRAEAEFVIRDEGPGFDPSTMADVKSPDQLIALSGRGTVLMWNVMDEVRYNDAGNEVTLVKRPPEPDESTEPDVD